MSFAFVPARILLRNSSRQLPLLSVRQRIGLVHQLISQFVYISLEYDLRNRQVVKTGHKRIGELSLTYECKLVYSLVSFSDFNTFKLMLNQALGLTDLIKVVFNATYGGD